jgi:predicted type IV restriction endonuclease
MSNLREMVDNYVKRVKDLAEHVRGNEQATKQSLIGPFFTMLGYDLTDPRECIPEYKADFGRDRSTKPIDWAFLNNGTFAFFVEAKEVGKKLAGYDEQLADYFAKDPNVKLGILTSGAQWRFFTDVVNPNVMDKEPFAKWDILADEQPPHDVITLLQKTQFNAELIRAYAQRQRAQNLIVNELARLLEPAPEFTKLAITQLETRNLTQQVVESWKTIVANALNEWARQRMLTAALTTPQVAPVELKTEAGKIETTEEELAAFATIASILGSDCPIAYEDSVAYFKIHMVERRTWVIARLLLDRRIPQVWVPIPIEIAKPLVGERTITTTGGWSAVTLESAADLSNLGALFFEAYSSIKRQKLSGDANVEA